MLLIDVCFRWYICTTRKLDGHRGIHWHWRHWICTVRDSREKSYSRPFWPSAIHFYCDFVHWFHFRIRTTYMYQYRLCYTDTILVSCYHRDCDASILKNTGAVFQKGASGYRTSSSNSTWESSEMQTAQIKVDVFSVIGGAIGYEHNIIILWPLAE